MSDFSMGLELLAAAATLLYIVWLLGGMLAGLGSRADWPELWHTSSEKRSLMNQHVYSRR